MEESSGIFERDEVGRSARKFTRVLLGHRCLRQGTHGAVRADGNHARICFLDLWTPRSGLERRDRAYSLSRLLPRHFVIFVIRSNAGRPYECVPTEGMVSMTSSIHARGAISDFAYYLTWLCLLLGGAMAESHCSASGDGDGRLFGA